MYGWDYKRVWANSEPSCGQITTMLEIVIKDAWDPGPRRGFYGNANFMVVTKGLHNSVNFMNAFTYTLGLLATVSMAETKIQGRSQGMPI